VLFRSLFVLLRSNLDPNLVEVSTLANPGALYWIDSGGGAVGQVAGIDCSQLQTTAFSVTNPIAPPPAFSYYPLRVVSPPSQELFQFAMLNTNFYGTGTAGRHPGIDFIEGLVSSGVVGTGVASVADGNLVGYCDPARNPPELAHEPGWVSLASPTDSCSNKSATSRAYVIIRHGNLVVLYAHLQPGLRIGAAVDAPVIRGQWLGVTAQNPEGPHLHFEGRTFGQNGFDISKAPLTFLNTWWYFDASTQQTINQNIQNRKTDDGQVVLGWDGTVDAGRQPSQCFASSVKPPKGAPTNTTGITLYGYDSKGNPTYSAFEWLDSSGNHVFVNPPLQTTWQTLCKP